MAATLKVTFWVSLATLLSACWHYDTLSADLAPRPVLEQPPRQAPASRQPFAVEVNDVRYAVRPLYEYELHGLVVSRRNHDGDFMLHRLWNDHLNVADLCVVWGSNARSLDLRAFDFRNGEFTCYVETRSTAAWRRFAPDALSNNHLLAADDDVRAAIRAAQVGDQVHFRGWLVEYANADGFHRGSSTTRDDTGNGACETVYVQSFRVTEPMPSTWRTLYAVSAWLAPLSALAYVAGVLRGTF